MFIELGDRHDHHDNTIFRNKWVFAATDLIAQQVVNNVGNVLGATMRKMTSICFNIIFNITKFANMLRYSLCIFIRILYIMPNSQKIILLAPFIQGKNMRLI